MPTRPTDNGIAAVRFVSTVPGADGAVIYAGGAAPEGWSTKFLWWSPQRAPRAVLFGWRLDGSGTFRQDLFYRINVVNLHMPALRERRGDIEDLTVYFLEYYNRKFNCRAKPLSNEVMSVLQKYHWPGNIRELENLVKRYVILGHEEVITNDLVAREPDFFNPEISWQKRTRPTPSTPSMIKLGENDARKSRCSRVICLAHQSAKGPGISDAGLPSNRSLRMRQAETAAANANTTAAAD